MTRKTAFFEGWSWFKFNNLGLALGTNLKFYTSLSKGLKLKVRKFWGLIPTFVEVTGEKLVGGGAFWTPILNRVKAMQSRRLLYKRGLCIGNITSSRNVLRRNSNAIYLACVLEKKMLTLTNGWMKFMKIHLKYFFWC